MKYSHTIYYRFEYYSSGWSDYVLLFLKLITCTHPFFHHIFLELESLNLGSEWLPIPGFMAISYIIQQYCLYNGIADKALYHS